MVTTGTVAAILAATPSSVAPITCMPTFRSATVAATALRVTTVEASVAKVTGVAVAAAGWTVMSAPAMSVIVPLTATTGMVAAILVATPSSMEPVIFMPTFKSATVAALAVTVSTVEASVAKATGAAVAAAGWMVMLAPLMAVIVPARATTGMVAAILVATPSSVEPVIFMPTFRSATVAALAVTVTTVEALVPKVTGAAVAAVGWMVMLAPLMAVMVPASATTGMVAAILVATPSSVELVTAMPTCRSATVAALAASVTTVEALVA